MAFYKEYDKNNKKKDHAASGSFADEGSSYRTPSKEGYARPAGRPAGRPAQGRGAKPYGRPAAEGDKPYNRTGNDHFQSGRKPYGRPAGDKPAFRARPEGAEGEKRVYGHPAPRSDFRGSVEKPAFRGRPDSDSGEKKPYGRPAPRGDFKGGFDKPAFRGRPDSGSGERKPYGRPAPVPAREVQAEPAYKRHEYKPAAPIAPAVPVYQEEAIDPKENLLSGRNPIREAIKSGRDIEKLLVAKGDLSGSAREIVAMAREARIPVQEVERVRLDEITRNHQGMLAFASAYKYATVEDMLKEAKDKGEDPFLILLDGITDPHNLGAIVRTAECVGAHGVIVPERRSVGLTPAAVKASAGAVEHVKVARVGNLTRTLQDLQKAGLWITAATTDGEDVQKADLSGPIALVIGSEGEGISRLVQEHCDRAVSLPLKGEIGSLNASVAAGVLMYAVLQKRNKG